MKERNMILGICNLCRLSTVFGGEPKILLWEGFQICNLKSLLFVFEYLDNNLHDFTIFRIDDRIAACSFHSHQFPWI
jgi:hypothetical protein